MSSIEADFIKGRDKNISNLFSSCRYDTIDSVYNHHNHRVFMVARVAEHSRQMFDLLFNFSRLFKCRYCRWQRGDRRKALFSTQHHPNSMYDSMDTCNYIRYLAQFETISVRTVHSTQKNMNLKNKTIQSKLKN